MGWRSGGLPMEFDLEVSRGNIPGISHINKFGRNPDIDQAASATAVNIGRTIWDGGIAGAVNWAGPKAQLPPLPILTTRLLPRLLSGTTKPLWRFIKCQQGKQVICTTTTAHCTRRAALRAPEPPCPCGALPQFRPAKQPARHPRPRCHGSPSLCKISTPGLRQANFRRLRSTIIPIRGTLHR